MPSSKGYEASWPLILLLCIATATPGLSQNTNSTDLLPGLVPDCAFPCLANALQQGGCGIADLADCVCTDIPLQANVSACVQLSCPFNDQVEVGRVSNNLCIDYPKESRSGQVRVTGTASAAITFTIVALRCVARLMRTKRLWWDDWMAVIATVSQRTLGHNVQAIGARMLSQSLRFCSQPQLVLRSRMFYATQMLYVLIQVSAKGSLLAFYARVFTSRKFRLWTWITVGFLVGHGAIFLGLVIFQCRPIASIWDRNLEPKCINLPALGYAGAITSIVEDIVILILPIPELLKLQLNRGKKIALLLMFSIGSFACVTSMIRLKYIVDFGNTLDAAWDNVYVVIWSIIELSCALICASLPALRPLLQMIPGVLSSTKASTFKGPSSRSGPGHRGSLPPRSASARAFKELPDLPVERSQGHPDKRMSKRGTYPDADYSSRDEEFEMHSVTKESVTCVSITGHFDPRVG
uniref:CFEM domain-containing protein n=1 Tax=Fusarium oxysporum (strain Fo5176) TaxID=660025 RepID=A0A0D2YHU5_FUSOF